MVGPIADASKKILGGPVKWWQNPGQVGWSREIVLGSGISRYRRSLSKYRSIMAEVMPSARPISIAALYIFDLRTFASVLEGRDNRPCEYWR